ncbi:MAG: YbgC/FadM family acyl-CoA thioesterase [Tepidimonas sp.]|uniref:YbgC/FadM family acyl-CoA thioesterase n=1 Tax=Tepidimonas sp. TaxID=2002775 RepID=UPI00298F2CBE|nr:YbgC/FadM family acyl-CoA thioesterase [Tepidimonas sp.]MCX7741809.1 YbgC/FadM family acyl-CoA thioesterase [Tepidimonas sp.]MDW8336717.1 YbgC/FadM family acyl-CoA thioesterase [Tepidimonas sp.]
MKRQEFRCLHRLRVRWSEVDLQGIVFNAHYLTYFDVGITEYWRQLGLPYQQAMQQLGGEPVVRKATLEYDAAARLDDWLEVGLRCERIGHTSLTMTAALWRGQQRLVSGEIVYVFVDLAQQRARPVPDALRDLIEGFERGEPMLRVVTGGWNELRADAAPLRRAVFVQEQGIAEQEEWDEADAQALHAVAYNRLGQAVGTGRLLQAEPGVGKIGRMAVHAALRGIGVGARLLQALTQAAQARGDHTLRLSAQHSAIGFYQRHGWEPVGAPYDEVGIPHQAMQRRLTAA